MLAKAGIHYAKIKEKIDPHSCLPSGKVRGNDILVIITLYTGSAP